MRDLIIMELSRLGLDPEKFVAWKVMLSGGTIFEALVATVLTQFIIPQIHFSLSD